VTRESQEGTELHVDIDNLYREEVFTDMRAASVRRLTPVKRDGSTDPARPVMFIGDTTLVTQMGPMPVQFQIEADNLEQAFEKFPEGVQEAVDRLQERAREMARDEASRIVMPSEMPPEYPGGTPPGRGGVPGGGKVRLK